MKHSLKVVSSLALLILFCASPSPAQITFYGPIDFGAGAPAVTSASWPIDTVATGWSSDPVSGYSLIPGGYGANGQSGSSGYTGASGANNACVENRVIGTYPTGAHLFSPAINTASYSNVEVRFGRRFSGSTNPITGTVSYSTDGGTNFVTTGLVGNVLTSPGNNSWAQVSVTGFPSASSLIVRWTASGSGSAGTQNLRIDDVEIIGVSTALNDGDGAATLSNNGAAPLSGTQMFQRNAGGQSVLLTVTGVSLGNLDKVVVTVPSTWSGLSVGNITLGGAFAGKTPVVSVNDVTINGAALGTTPGTIAIASLTTPAASGPLLNGNDTWIVKTAKLGGTADTILVPPKSYTIIPIQNLRTGGVDGFGNSDAGGLTSAMNGQVVAVSGIATVENQIISSSASQTSFFIQNNGYGLQVFKAASPATSWVRGDSMVIRGTVGGFNGSMQITPPSTSPPDFINVGAGVLPASTVLPNANAIGEQYEGRVVRVNTVTWDSTGLTYSSTAGHRNSFRTAPADTGSLFMSSTNTVVGTVIPTNGDVVGLVYHRVDIGSGSGVPLYLLAVRDLFDIVSSLADGSGTATLVNATAGTYNGSTVFPRNAGGLTVTVSITGAPTGTLDKVKLTVPAGWSGYSSGNVTLGGAFSGKTPVFASNDIQINSAGLGTTAGTIAITGLTSPNAVGAGVSGADAWQVQTAVLGGTLTGIAAQPKSNAIIPIANLRTGGTDGYGNSDVAGTTPVLDGTVVAVQGVITVANRVLAETTSTSIIIQDGTYGVQVFRSGSQSHTTLLLGDQIVAKGTVSAFHGNTEILPASVTAPNIFNLGPGSLPAPQTLPGAVAVAESTEARLVALSSVTWDSAGQLFLVSSSSSADNNFKTGTESGTIYVNSVSNIDGTVIPASSPVSGVVYHRADWVGGGQQVYKIAPRNLADLGGSSVTTTLLSGWNMISNPVTTTLDSMKQLFPTSLFTYGFAFAGAGGYQQRYRLENGVGYWGKFPGATTVAFTGDGRTQDTIEVAAGWNMVGSISSPVDTSTITSDPPGIRASGWIGFPYSAGEPTILPGKGYWVKVLAPGGRFFFTTAPAPALRSKPDDQYQKSGK